MISTLLTAVISLSSLSFAYSVPQSKRGDGTLRLPVAATPFSALDVLSSLHSRQTVSTVKNVQTGTRYMVEFQIGTPPQAISIALDTGSSETWVDPACANSGSQSQADLCNSFPRYTAANSSSAVDLGSNKVLNYGKGSASIEYYTDDFVVGGASVKNQKFGVATTSSSIPTGLMGVGPGHELTGYNTIIDELALQGVTQSRAFSLDLRSVDSPDGAIIFGGIDTMKYKGALEKCPIIPAAESPDQFDRYWIYMKSVGITKPGEAPKTYTSAITNPKGQPVFLDSGGTLSRLPTPIFNAILADFPGATQDGTSGIYLVDCALSSQAGSVDFGFGNTIINVPYNEFIWHIQGYCYLGVAADDNTPVLGDTFLRSAFVVYDQDNKNLLLANAANCGSNLVAIGKGVDAVPSVVGACGAPASSTSSSSSSSTPAPTSTSSSTSSVKPTIASNSSSTEIPSSSISTDLPSLTIEPSTTPSSSSNVSSVTDIPDYTPTIPSVSVPYPTKTSLPVVITPYPTAYYPISTSTKAGYSNGTSTNAGYLNSTSTTKYTTSTVCTTATYTNEAGQTTTEVISLYTTVCPVTEAEATPNAKATPYPTAWSVSTVYATTTYTITSCAPTVTNCPVGHVTTDTISLYTTLCPVEAATHYPTPADTYSTTTSYTTIKSTVTLAAPAKIYTSFTAKPMSSVYKVVAPANSTVMVYPVASSTSTAAGYPTSKPVQFTGAAAGQGAGNMVMVGLTFVGLLFMM